MEKTLKLFLLIIILLFLFFNTSLATSNEANSTELEIPSTISSSDESENTEYSNTSSTSTYNPSSYGTTTINRVNSYSEANLGLNNILNIILISIGILIILFAIAILIRLKK